MTVVASDNFNRADSGSLGANWVTDTSALNPSIQSNRVPTGSGGTSGAYWNSDTATTDDMYTKVNVVVSTSHFGNWPQLWVRRANTGAETGYLVMYSSYGNLYQFRRMTAGADTILKTVSGGPLAVGTYSVEARGHGNDIELWVDGAFVDSVTDSTYKSSSYRRSGFRLYNDVGNYVFIDDFEMGDAPPPKPAVRTFNGSSDQIDLDEGSALAGGMFDGTFICVMKMGADSWGVPFAGTGWRIIVNPSGQFGFSGKAGSGDSYVGGGPTAADGWVFVAVVWNTGAAPAFWKYVYSTDTWSQATGGSTVTLAVDTMAQVNFGADDHNENFYNGSVAGAAVFKSTYLTNTQIRTLAADWATTDALSPTGMWVLDQTSTATALTDATGNGANQTAITGTSVTLNASPMPVYAPSPVADLAGVAAAAAGLAGDLTSEQNQQLPPDTRTGIPSALLTPLVTTPTWRM